ncbi:MAG: hypothetical protein WDM90_00065 [Ferruginibacter sp.]
MPIIKTDMINTSRYNFAEACSLFNIRRVLMKCLKQLLPNDLG